MSEPKKLPAFSSEASEAAWWFENSDKHDEEFFQRVQNGGIRREGLARRVAAAQGLTPIRLDTQDISKAKSLAERRGMEVASYLSLLMHEALERESQGA